MTRTDRRTPTVELMETPERVCLAPWNASHILPRPTKMRMRDAFQGARQTRPGVSIGSTVGVLLSVLVIVVLFWRGHAFTNADGRYGRAIDHVSEVRDLQNATSMSAVIHMPAGELNISGGTSHAIEGDFDYSAAWSRPRLEYHVSGKAADLDIS